MSIYWLLFASLSVVGSVIYTATMKVGSTDVNPFGFVFVLTAAILFLLGVCCVVAKYGFKVDVTEGMNPRVLKYAFFCACGSGLTNVCYVLALRYGAATSSLVFWAIGGIVAFAIFAFLFMGETMNLMKILGIVLGITSVILITKAS